MITRFPLPECPTCGYSLRGHPEGGRCPECGFEWDVETLVFRPSRPWKTCVGLLAAELLVFWFLMRPIATLLNALMEPFPATLVVFLIVVLVLTGSVMYVWRANRQRRFLALSPKGLVVQNLQQDLVVIPYEEIMFIAMDDSVPWVQRRGGEPLSLYGIFDHKRERGEFRAAASAARAGGYAALRQPRELAAESRGVLAQQGVSPADGPEAAAALPERPVSLTRIGVSILALALLGMILGGLFWERAVHAAVLLFWIGAGLALIGQWRSDPRGGKPGR